MNYTTGVAALVTVLALSWITRRRSTIRTIVGPPSPSWIFGNMLQLLISPEYGDYEFNWGKMYGPVYRIKGCLGNTQRLKLIMCAGEDHRQLRAFLNPAFAAAAVRQYQAVFTSVAQRITERLDLCEAPSVDVCPLLCDATLSSISEALFGCPVEDLNADFVEGNSHILELTSTQSASHILFDGIGSRLPGWFLRHSLYLPIKSFNVIRAQLNLAQSQGWRLVSEKAEAAKQGLELEGDIDTVNSSASDSRSIREEDIVAQTPLMTVAGQDTTAKTLAFGLIELAKNPQFQESLRAEIHAALQVGTVHGNISYDSMPLLNAFIKESLRMYPALPIADRMASEDVVIPLSQSVATTNGKRVTQIHIRKGELVTLALASYQRIESRWGADADKFRPSRWLDGTVYQGEAVGPYGNLLSFLGGPRMCLGWRFAVFEMQVFLCELVGKFSFSLPAGHSAKVKFANTLLPTDAHGNKCALLCVDRI
ncbi:cytochrome P450 [Mycena pura]|uniref:Cytochrome P450 n=1 Tax=Mycena pura TaxID=153505 RepID=A0AAD6VDL5_9AGAR|nr:cytochrome P450 [Mycena pura]